MFHLVKKVIDEHRATLDPSCPRDVIDSYLLEMEKQKDSPNVIFNGMEKFVIVPHLHNKSLSSRFGQLFPSFSFRDGIYWQTFQYGKPNRTHVRN